MLGITFRNNTSILENKKELMKYLKTFNNNIEESLEMIESVEKVQSEKSEDSIEELDKLFEDK